MVGVHVGDQDVADVFRPDSRRGERLGKASSVAGSEKLAGAGVDEDASSIQLDQIGVDGGFDGIAQEAPGERRIGLRCRCSVQQRMEVDRCRSVRQCGDPSLADGEAIDGRRRELPDDTWVSGRLLWGAAARGVAEAIAASNMSVLSIEVSPGVQDEHRELVQFLGSELVG